MNVPSGAGAPPQLAAVLPERVVSRTMDRGSGFRRGKVGRHTAAFMCAGKAEYTFGRQGGERITFLSGDILWMPEGTWREASFLADSSRFFSVQFRVSQVLPAYDSVYAKLMRGPVIVQAANPGYVEGLFRRLHRLRGHPGGGAYLEMQGVLLQILAAVAQAFEQKGVSPHVLYRIHEVEEYILNHFDDPSLSVARLAQRSGWSIKHFIACFKEATGQTPVAYLRRVRINHALDLLAQEDLSVQEVAWMVGYKDPAYFSRIFRRTVGYPPSQAFGQRKTGSPKAL